MSGLALHAYRAATWALTPLAGVFLHRRVRAAKEDPARLRERLGHASLPRPAGRLLWVHAASVGETMSVLPLLDAIARTRPAAALLLTTGTVTSARMLAAHMLAGRMPINARHQFVPLDVPGAVSRFLDHWRPDGALWVESELWPNLLSRATARGVPLALVNGRLSPRSAARWSQARGLARDLLGGFAIVLARSEADAERLRALGAPGAHCIGDLKDAAPPLPADPGALACLRAALADHPVWVAASTHPGEEVLCAVAHDALAARLPGLRTVIVPRHPERGPAIRDELRRGFRAIALRSVGDPVGPGITVADTLGELGLFYRVAMVAFVGGSLVPHGGHNPLEPARLGCPVLLGPHTDNVAEAADRLIAAGAATRIDVGGLADAVLRVLTQPTPRIIALPDEAVVGRAVAALDPVLRHLG